MAGAPAQESWTRIEAWPKTPIEAAQKLETERLWDRLPQNPDLPLYFDVGS